MYEAAENDLQKAVEEEKEEWLAERGEEDEAASYPLVPGKSEGKTKKICETLFFYVSFKCAWLRPIALCYLVILVFWRRVSSSRIDVFQKALSKVLRPASEMAVKVYRLDQRKRHPY